MRVLAIIPARAGSKRLPGKNMTPLCGKPLVQWSIEAAQRSRSITEILVTSDDTALLKLATELRVPHVLHRPAELAGDKAKSSDVILHALQSLTRKGVLPDVVCLLQPTSPLRTPQDIDDAFNHFLLYGLRPVISVCELDHPLAWCNSLADDYSMHNFAACLNGERRSQDLKTHYRLNGAIYLATTAGFQRDKAFLTNDAVAFIMPRERSLDVDTSTDLILAEALLAHRLSR